MLTASDVGALPLNGSVPMSGALKMKSDKAMLDASENVVGITIYDDDEKVDYSALHVYPMHAKGELTNLLSLMVYANNKNNSYKIFGEHNKPNGSYTGNGSSTKREIAIDGVGNLLVITRGSLLGLVCYGGAVVFDLWNGVATYFNYEKANFRNSILTLATDSTLLNDNGSGYSYGRI